MKPPRSLCSLPPEGALAAARQSRFRARPWSSRFVRCGWFAALLLASASAHAGLFDDEEARKAIADVRARVAVIEEQNRLRGTEAGAQNAQLAEQLSALRRSLLDLNNQLEAMRGEIAKLRGSDEQLQRDVADLQKRQRDTAQAFDDRLRRTEPVKVALDGREFMAEPDEKRAFDEAFATIRSGDFDKAVSQLTAFQKRHPASGYTDAVRFWLGNAQYGRRDYKDAIATFRSFVNAAPDHPRAPEALLAIANSQAEMKDPRAARKTIDDLMKAYPKSEAAQAGRERLASIR